MFQLLKKRNNITINEVKEVLEKKGFDINNPLMWEDKIFSENSDTNAKWIHVVLHRSKNYNAEILIVIGNNGSYLGHKTPLIIFSDSDDYGIIRERWRLVFNSKEHLSEIIYDLKNAQLKKVS